MTRRVAGATGAACVLCAALCTGTAAAQAPAPLARSVPAGVVRLPGNLGPRFATSTGGKSRPDLEPARITGELLAGAYAGIGGYFLGSWSIGGLAELTDMSDAMKEHIAFVGGVLGAGAATAASVYAIGNIGDQTGSFPVAVGGTAAGVAVGILLNQMIYGHARLPSEGESSRMRWVEASLEAMLPSIGATIAFNSTRRYK
jgi:hypothetical protein